MPTISTSVTGTEPLLTVDGLVVSARRRHGDLKVVDGAGFQIRAGERVALVGESGSGKSVTCMSVMGLLAHNLDVTGGDLMFQGKDVRAMSDSRIRAFRGREMSMIYQEPLTSLNPLMRVSAQLKESAARVGIGSDGILEMLAKVGFADPARVLRQYPHELSGGMRQRVMIAMALLGRPKLLLADEPTTALDVTIQSEVLKLMYDLSVEMGTAVLIVSHDLAVVRKLADTVHVMYAGQIVESGPTAQVLAQPRHPYTRALLESAPRVDDQRERLDSIPGIVPTPDQWDGGCRFRSRCTFATAECETAPPMLEIGAAAGQTRRSACWHSDALKEEVPA